MRTHRYQVLSPLLASEGSRAYLALRIPAAGDATPAVLVWLPEKLAEDPDALAQLRRDTQRASHLEHPHITRVFGLESLEQGLARAVEYSDGESLRAMLRETGGKLPPLIAARVLADAASGIDYAHVAGNDDGSPLLHGDLRPETLMLTYGGVTKVAGYGALAVAPRESGGERVPGRRLYSAPEQMLGGRNAIDRQGDVFLLGLTLYECLTGKVPFADAVDRDRAVVQSPLPRVRGDAVLEALHEVVQKATAKRASHRHASARAFREHLVEAVEGIPSHESVAAYLMNFFVEERPARLQRQEVLERALSALLRGGRVAVVPTRDAEESVAAEAPAPRLPQRARRPAPSRTPVREPSHVRLAPEDEEPARRRGPWGRWVLAAVGVGALLGWALLRGDEPRTRAAPAEIAAENLTPLPAPAPLVGTPRVPAPPAMEGSSERGPTSRFRTVRTSM